MSLISRLALAGGGGMPASLGGVGVDIFGPSVGGGLPGDSFANRESLQKRIPKKYKSPERIPKILPGPRLFIPTVLPAVPVMIGAPVVRPRRDDERRRRIRDDDAVARHHDRAGARPRV